MHIVSPGPLAPRTAKSLADRSPISAAIADQSVYTRFRVREPNLVAYFDEHRDAPNAETFFTVVYVKEDPAACASFIVDRNAQKTNDRSYFGRLDLVMTFEQYRGFGLGRIVMLAALGHAIETYGNRLYSISCLAAHEAVAHVLESLGFERRVTSDELYVQEQYALDDSAAVVLVDSVVDELSRSAQRAAYRVRQSKSAP